VGANEGTEDEAVEGAGVIRIVFSSLGEAWYIFYLVPICVIVNWQIFDAHSSSVLQQSRSANLNDFSLQVQPPSEKIHLFGL